MPKLSPEQINPYDNTRGKTEQVREMFDNIAPSYDSLNRAMSFGLDRSWRAKAVRMVGERNPESIVDIATGTGDFAISLARAIPGAKVTGLDLSEGMIAVGREKVERSGLADRVTLTPGDCLASPLPEGEADAVTVAFGVRNFADLAAGYRSMYRMLRPGGMLCVIELSVPSSRLVRPFYDIYTRGIIPIMGRAVSADRRAYSYLPESIAAVPCRENMCRLMTDAGFTDATYRTLTLGVCTIYTAFKPA
ncbi:MAG: bifunctional demethylmenaquinone methyltransferase/2-methoxy-6-polyprenyl-1,4-benzoquinol methylase UbiE [Muribaculaceae bacterium]|nr:bifunctional demethylmenaquinone methyltransferase/2-methoxy-6-polyprenyl-1,4-benzoquinol methylase UbiE [Muribaculaceae bacterium]